MLNGITREAQLFIMAKASSEETRKAISTFITYSDTMKPLVTGKILRTLGIEEGPVLGEILEALHDAKIDQNLATKEEELEFVRIYTRARGLAP